MWQTIINYLTPVKYPGDDAKSRQAFYIHIIALVFMGAILVAEISLKIIAPRFDLNNFDAALIGIVLLIFGVWTLSRYGYTKAAGALLTFILWVTVNGSAATGFGIRDDSFLGNFVVLLAAGLLVGWQGALALSALTIATGFGLAYAEENGLLQPAEYFTSPYTAFLAVGVIIGIFTGLMAVVLSSLEGAIIRTQSNARDLESVNRDLRVARTRLEENQAELLVANDQLKRRAERISGIASIAKTITVVQEIDRLLPVVVEAVSERFQFEHVGVYLLEESGQSAALSASSSDEGRQSLLAGNRVVVGSESLIGVVTDRGEPRGILTNPQRRDAYMAQHRMIARLQYGEFIKRLDLSPADVDALVEILAQRQMAMLGRNLGVQPADPATMSRQVADLDAAEASDIAALLGADKAERFANYRSTLQERSILTPLVQELDLARKPLKPEQVDELARILKQETGAMREKMPIAPATFANGPNENQASRPSASAQRAYAKEVLDWQLELNQRIADRTAQLLTPEQQMRFVASQQQQIELQRLSMALIEPDTPAN